MINFNNLVKTIIRTYRQPISYFGKILKPLHFTYISFHIYFHLLSVKPLVTCYKICLVYTCLIVFMHSIMLRQNLGKPFSFHTNFCAKPVTPLYTISYTNFEPFTISFVKPTYYPNYLNSFCSKL